MEKAALSQSDSMRMSENDASDRSNPGLSEVVQSAFADLP